MYNKQASLDPASVLETLTKLFGLRRVLIGAAVTLVLDGVLTFWRKDAQLDKPQMLVVFLVALAAQYLASAKARPEEKDKPTKV